MKRRRRDASEEEGGRDLVHPLLLALDLSSSVFS